jgi:hypothetical protein
MKNGNLLTKTSRSKLVQNFQIFVNDLEKKYEHFDYTEFLLTNAKDYKNLRRVHRKKLECKRVLAASKLLLSSNLFNVLDERLT